MSSYSSRLEKHLKNQAKQIRKDTELSHSTALEQAAIEFGFSGWRQARAHMAWVESHVPVALADLPSITTELARSLRSRKGYPYFHEPLTNQRVDPSDMAQCEQVASRILLVGLIDELHAPLNLCRSHQAQMWLRPTLPMDVATDEQRAMSWKVVLHARTLALYGSETTNTPIYTSKPTPDEVRETLLRLLHATYSMSVSFQAIAGAAEVLEHPGFREYVGYALSAAREMSWPTEGIGLLLEYANIGHWQDYGSAPAGSKSLLWAGRPRLIEQLDKTRSESSKASHLPPPRRALSAAQHKDLAYLLANLDIPTMGSIEIQRKLTAIQETLIAWMAQKSGHQAAEELYFQRKRTVRKVRFLAPAQVKALKHQISGIQRVLAKGAVHCSSKAHVLRQVVQVEQMLNRWIGRTGDHWARLDQKLVMDSIGLVAADPKDELLYEGESLWQQVEVMGTAREENLVEVSRAHLYRIWKEEDDAEGWPFDASSQETEDSLREHLEGLTYYRYVGSATTRKSFLTDVRKGFYFEPTHVWFKQRLID